MIPSEQSPQVSSSLSLKAPDTLESNWSTTYCLLTWSIDHFLHLCIFETITQDSNPMLYVLHLSAEMVSSSSHNAFHTAITTSIPFYLAGLSLIVNGMYYV